MRIDKRVTHARLCGEMHTMGHAILKECVFNGRRIGKVSLDETEILVLAEFGETGAFERHVIIVIHIVKADDRGALRQKASRNMKADKSGGSGNKYGHKRGL